jgi:hypothetical protein
VKAACHASATIVYHRSSKVRYDLLCHTLNRHRLIQLTDECRIFVLPKQCGGCSAPLRVPQQSFQRTRWKRSDISCRGPGRSCFIHSGPAPAAIDPTVPFRGHSEANLAASAAHAMGPPEIMEHRKHRSRPPPRRARGAPPLRGCAGGIGRGDIGRLDVRGDPRHHSP